ncbi:hypothetical protein ACFV2B_29890 [Streptomyces lavendulae]|uniref:hypothetical protein n=1 Tax=Streptomyces lavendulae TaxID=1914 RepID=UPI00368D2C63
MPTVRGCAQPTSGVCSQQAVDVAGGGIPDQVVPATRWSVSGRQRDVSGRQ